MVSVNEIVIYTVIVVGLYFVFSSDELQKKYMPEMITKFPHNQRQIGGAVLVAGGAYLLTQNTSNKLSSDTSTLPLPTDLQSSTINLSSF